MPVIKKIFVANQPIARDDKTFFPLFRAADIFHTATGEAAPFTVASAQMQRSYAEHAKRKVHVDEIKRWCHVPVT